MTKIEGVALHDDSPKREKELINKTVDLYNEIYNYLISKNVFLDETIEHDKKELAEGIHIIQDLLIRRRLYQLEPDFFD